MHRDAAVPHERRHARREHILTFVAAHQFAPPWSSILPPAATLLAALWHLYAPSPAEMLHNPWKAPADPKATEPPKT